MKVRIINKQGIPSTFSINWFASKVVVYGRRRVMEMKKSTDDDISILEKPAVCGRSPPRASRCSSRLRTRHKARLPAHQADQDHQWG